MKDRIAVALITIDAPTAIVWGGLTKPKIIKKYMFGTEVVSKWQVGSPIIWKGVWQGKAYKDKGTILQLEENRVLQFSHFSPLSGQPDTPENYHTVTIELKDKGVQTTVKLSQDNNPTEEARQHSEKNWQMMLDGLKKLLEEYLAANSTCSVEDIEK